MIKMYQAILINLIGIAIITLHYDNVIANINAENIMLQEKVWSYQSHIETHTVETHIYRLRKKIKEVFNDENLITSEKNGYLIK